MDHSILEAQTELKFRAISWILLWLLLLVTPSVLATLPSGRVWIAFPVLLVVSLRNARMSVMMRTSTLSISAASLTIESDEVCSLHQREEINSMNYFTGTNKNKITK